ncbi:MAG: hypothetical protein WC747_03495 [Candidatus Babeliales bacterium]|jgi:hypothetical protein
MKLFQCKIIFLLTLFCVQNQWTCEAQKAYEVMDEKKLKKMHQAIRDADLSFVDRQKQLSEQMALINKAILCRYQVFGYSYPIDVAISEAKRLYCEECNARKRNHVTEVLYSQALIAFLQGHRELGSKYVSEVHAIKTKQFEKRTMGLGLIKGLPVEEL